MKFGSTFTEYLLGEKVSSFDLNKCSHVEYKRLKKVLKVCRHHCQGLNHADANNGASCGDEFRVIEEDRDQNNTVSDICRYRSCQWCDRMFFSEIMKEASDITGCISSRVRHLVQLHCNTGMQRYLLHLFQCFKNDQQALVLEGQMLIEYVIMNAIALRKILKKYDKVHNSVSGMNFRSKLQAEHLEISQSPWLIELVAFYINFSESNEMICNELCSSFSCDLSVTDSEPVLKLVLPDYAVLEYNLTCAVCLHTVFHPYALSCGHIFCKMCACSSGSVLMFEGVKSASPKMKCPVCREDGVFGNAVRMTELDLLLKRRFRKEWEERLVEERDEVSKQTKEFWESQTRYFTGL
ncbi:probable E3 ubiquitin-protein ligase BAH1-like [Lactuca sativa]|uniref:probable E3 ubiquitin-protein ligase BAH1-like n=1 Tax=Lactuca sativa TaxID=4236 RepID=UPI000CBAC8E6|nr:probable E3 ubiquitin-protein ligase BAH1-like [Lactuca sativa]